MGGGAVAIAFEGEGIRVDICGGTVSSEADDVLGEFGVDSDPK